MNKDDLENKMQTLTTPQFSGNQHQTRLKMAVINSKRSARTSLWLLLVPFLFLAEGLLQTLLKISIPSWSSFQQYAHSWPVWVRMAIFMVVLIVIPLLAAILNFLSITWFHYDYKKKVLNVSIRFRLINVVITIIGGLLALLFITHSILEYIRNAH